MAARQSNGRASAVNPVTLESIADIGKASLTVRRAAGLPAIELLINGQHVLLLSTTGAGALISALIEAVLSLAENEL